MGTEGDDHRPADRLDSDGHMPIDRTCDCHVHVFDPARFPYAASRTYTPGAAPVAALDAFRRRLGMSRSVLVQPSVYGTDNVCLVDALAALGASTARGVAVIDPGRVGDDELRSLHRAGVRGIRVNLESRGEKSATSAARAIAAVADRAAPHGFGVQIFADLPLVADLAAQLAESPVPVVLDHFAGAKAALGVGQPGFAALVDLLRAGAVWVKLSGVYRVSRAGPRYDDVRAIAEALIAANPDRLVWASDWPHTGDIAGRRQRAPGDVEPFQAIDDAAVLRLLSAWTGDRGLDRRILVDNPALLYGFD